MGKVWYFRLNVFFDLMSANITTNYRALQIKPIEQLPHLFYLLPGIFLSVYQIKAHKFQRLLLDINLNTNVQVSFFDGSGYKTPKQLFVPSGTLTIQSSTFQCLLHFASFSTSAASSNKTFHFSFHAIQLKTSKTVQLSKNSHHTVHFSSKVCTPVNYVMFLIPFEARTNVSFTNYMFSGVQNAHMALFLSLNTMIVWKGRSDQYAMPVPLGQHQTYIFVVMKQEILFYAYSDYVIFDIQLNISTTECEVVQMHICELNKLCQTQLVPGNFRNYLRRHSLSDKH